MFRVVLVLLFLVVVVKWENGMRKNDRIVIGVGKGKHCGFVRVVEGTNSVEVLSGYYSLERIAGFFKIKTVVNL